MRRLAYLIQGPVTVRVTNSATYVRSRRVRELEELKAQKGGAMSDSSRVIGKARSVIDDCIPVSSNQANTAP